VWSVRSRRVEVYLGETLVGWRVAGEAAARWETTASVEEGLALMARWGAEDAMKKRLRVWLGSSLARPWVLAVDAGARSSAEARALATATARDMTGWNDATVWVEPWRAGRPTACVAVPNKVKTALIAKDSSTSGAVVRVESLRPWWNRMLDDILPRTRAERSGWGWSLAEPDGLVCGTVREGKLDEVRFESRKTHDLQWTLLRKRLSVTWAEMGGIDHRRFVRDDVTANPAPMIGQAQRIDEDGVDA